MRSPCVRICQMDTNGLCVGCKRTAAEIGDWFKFTNEQREQIMKETETREIVLAKDQSEYSF